MAIISTLRSFLKSPTFFKNTVLNSNLAARRSCHDRHMVVRPSTFEYNQFKDDLHFYTLLGLIPSLLIVGLTNMFIGPAELRETPEGYEPEHWEYFRYPISRFISKYIGRSPQENYEKYLHLMVMEHEKTQLKRLENRVRKLMQQRGDSVNWYFAPVDAVKYATHHVERYEQMNETERFGYSGTGP